MVYYLKTLGQLSIHAEDPDREPLLANSKSLALLAYVAASSNYKVRRDHVADLFWPDADRSRSRQSLRQALYYLRTKLGESLLESDGDELLVDEEQLDVDVWALDRALQARDYERVVELYDGPFLATFQGRTGRELETWIETRNERAWTALKAALHQLVTESLEGGDPAGAVRHARRYVRLNPFRESAQTALIRALVAADRPVEAIQAYESYRTLLAEELDDEPGRELRTLVGRLRGRVFHAPVPEAGEDEAETPGRAREPEAAAPASPKPDPNDLRPLAAAALVLLVLALLTNPPIPGIDAAGSGPGSGPPRTVPAAVLVVGGAGPNLSVVSVGDSIRLEPGTGAGGDLPDPTGSRVATAVRTAEGIDLGVRATDSDSVRVVVDLPHDENPLAWSPDGRHLVYRNGWMDPDGIHYRRRLRVRDLETGRDWRLADAPVPTGGVAAWSPTGAWIAFDAVSGDGDLDVWISRPDGSGVRRLTTSPEPNGRPDFSPDGRWIAYAAGPEGSRSLEMVRRDGSRAIPLVDTGFDDHDPVWRTDSRVLFLSTRDDRTQLWEYDLNRDRRRSLGQPDDAVRLIPDARRYADRWIEELRIAPRPEAVAPGQWVAFRADGRSASGRATGVPDDAVVWSTPSSGVLRPVRGSLFRVLATGEGRIVARIPGWRSDTLRVRSRALRHREGPLLLAEDWGEGLGGDRWYTVGAPAPAVVDGPGRFSAALRNNGDAHYGSGVISTDAFPTREGLTLEAWVRAPMTGRHYQQVKLALRPDPDPPGTEAWGAGGAPIEVAVSGDPDGVRCMVNGRRVPIPAPDSLDRWQRLALQLHPDGRTSVLLNGRLLWVDPAASSESLPRRAHVVLGGRTVGTDVLVGPVTLHRGPRYVLP